jgi:hypothetical protein
MNRLRIIPIVEGHGEEAALPILLRRIWTELLGGEFIDVMRPNRCKRDRLISSNHRELDRFVELSIRHLSVKRDATPELILVVVDAEDDLACQLGPTLLQRAQECRPDMDITCVVANRCYETWFAAAADSLRHELDLTSDTEFPSDPETQNLRKSWVERRIRRAKYSETSDQARLTAIMDLSQCRANSPSFDKLCRELEGRLHRGTVG